MATPTEPQSIDITELDLEEVISEGKFGVVYRGKLRNHCVAVKRCRRPRDESELPHEVALLHSVSHHRNIVSLIGVAFNRFDIFIVTELAEEGSLFNYIHERAQQPTTEDSHTWATEVAQGMEYLHTNNIVHCDLKSANILLTHQRSVKLCDFGTARQLMCTTEQTGRMGTYRWMAPEVMEGEGGKINQRCDTFSYGMVLYEVFTGTIPYADTSSEFEVGLKILHGERPPVPSTLPRYLKHLMLACWEYDSHKRPTFKEIVRALDSKAFKHVPTLLPCSVSFTNLMITNKPGGKKHIRRTHSDSSGGIHSDSSGGIHSDSDDDIIALSDLEIGAQVFKRDFSNLYIGKWKRKLNTAGELRVTESVANDVAVKICSTTPDEFVPLEVKVFRSIKPHPNIVHYHGVAFNAPSYHAYIVMELLPGVSLHTHLHDENRKPTLTAEQSVAWALQLASALEHLHSCYVVHCNLTSFSVLLSSCGEVKLCGFGSAQFSDHQIDHGKMVDIGRWTAPEILDNERTTVDPAYDAFSYGMILYELFVHRKPFYDQKSNVRVAVKILKGERPQIPPTFPGMEYIHRLLQACWSHEPKNRPTFQAISKTLNTKFFDA